VAIQQRGGVGKPSCIARADPMLSARESFSPGILSVQTPFPQMSVDSTEAPISVTVSEICFAGEIKKRRPWK
jgi:hypothetical protein